MTVTLHWSKEALSYLWCSSRTQGILIPIIPVSAPALLPLLPVLLSLFGQDSSLQSVILPLQRGCRCLSAQRNCLPLPNLKIKRVMRGDCPHLFCRWQAWTVVSTYWWKWEPEKQCLELNDNSLSSTTKTCSGTVADSGSIDSMAVLTVLQQFSLKIVELKYNFFFFFNWFNFRL